MVSVEKLLNFLHSERFSWTCLHDLSFVLAYKNLSEAGHFSLCLLPSFPHVKSKGRGRRGLIWEDGMAMMEWPDWAPLYGREFSQHVSVEFVQPLSLGFFLFLTTSLRSMKDGIFNLLKIKPGEVPLREIHSMCHRLAGGKGKVGPHLVPSLLPIRLSKREKKTKRKPWRVNSSC